MAEQGFPGTSGLIRFGPDHGEPVAKRLTLMRVARVTDTDTPPVEVYHCGVADVPGDGRCAAVPPPAG